MGIAERILNPRKTTKKKYAQVAKTKIAGRVEYYGVESSEEGRQIGTIRLPGYYPNAESAEEYLRSQGYIIPSDKELNSMLRATQLKERQELARKPKKTIDEHFEEMRRSSWD